MSFPLDLADFYFIAMIAVGLFFALDYFYLSPAFCSASCLLEFCS